jgi:hypothetical protein
MSDRADLVWAAAFALEFGSAYTRWRSIERDRVYGAMSVSQQARPDLSAFADADRAALREASRDARDIADAAVRALQEAK